MNDDALLERAQTSESFLSAEVRFELAGAAFINAFRDHKHCAGDHHFSQNLRSTARPPPKAAMNLARDQPPTPALPTCRQRPPRGQVRLEGWQNVVTGASERLVTNFDYALIMCSKQALSGLRKESRPRTASLQCFTSQGAGTQHPIHFSCASARSHALASASIPSKGRA